jgi:hypothetical protein
MTENKKSLKEEEEDFLECAQMVQGLREGGGGFFGMCTKALGFRRGRRRTDQSWNFHF